MNDACLWNPICENEYIRVMDGEVEPYLQKCRREFFLPSPESETQTLHVLQYEAQNPKGVIAISHGFTEGAQKYEEMVYYFLKEGYHVFLAEHMGHGLSYRLTENPSLVHTDCWQRYVKDFLSVCHEMKQKYPKLPLYLFAHSMGGGIGAACAAWEPELFDRVVLSSPMIRPLTGGVPWPAAVLITKLQCLLGNAEHYVLGQGPYEGNDTFADSVGTSEARYQRYREIRSQRKELQTWSASYGWLNSAMGMSRYLRRKAWKQVKAPVLLVQAECETLVSLKAQRKFAEKVNRQGQTNCRCVSIPGSKHEIYCSEDMAMQQYCRLLLNFL